MTRKWHGRDECMKKTWRGRDFKKSELGSWLQLLLFRFWCIFDLVFSPILFSVFSLVKKRSEQCERSQVANRDDRHVTGIVLASYADFLWDRIKHTAFVQIKQV